MATGGSRWDAGDVATADRMNQKTVLVDTGVNIAAFASPQTGMHARCTSSGSGFAAGEDYVYDGTAWRQLTGNDIEVYPYSTTIGDYSTPTSVTASSDESDFTDDFASYASQGAADTAWPSSDTADMRVNITNDNIDTRFETDNTADVIYHDLGAGAVSDTAWVLRFSLNVSSKSVNCYLAIGIGDNTNASNVAQDFIGMGIQHESINKLITSMDTDGVAVTVAFGTPDNFTTFDPATGTTYYLEVVRISSTSYEVRRYTDGTYSSIATTVVGTCASTTQTLRYIKIMNRVISGTGTIVATIDNFKFWNGVSSAPDVLNAIDGSTTTNFQSNSEVNPWLRLELSSIADKEPAAIAIYPHANTTATQIKIQTSPDGSTWTDKRLLNVSALSMAAWNYIRFNRDSAQVRYVRIYGNDGSAKALAISEVKVLMPTESQWNRRHGHIGISSTDAAIALTG